MADLEQPAWSSIDDESLNLILSLQDEDASRMRMRSHSKGKQIEGVSSDADLALQLHAEELERAAVCVSDRKMTKSLQSAVQTDTNVLFQFEQWESVLEPEQWESVSQQDREMATAQTAGRPVNIQTNEKTWLSPIQLEAWEKMMSKYVLGTDCDESDERDDSSSHSTDTSSSSSDGWSDAQPESSSWAASRNCKSPGRPCIACGDIKTRADLVQAPCKHDYCGQCLEHLFRSAMVDESLFPPRCCRQDIPIDAIGPFLSDDLIEQFIQKSIELATPNRTYCHQPKCSTFIPSSNIKNGVAQCPKCETQTCETCKGATHGGDCPSDAGIQQVLEIARQEGWKRCPKCSTMIELNMGCYHITCICDAEFCYLCATEWKKCTCDHGDEERLYDRAEQIMNRNRNPGLQPEDEVPANPTNHENPANPQPAAERRRTREIGRIMEHLVHHHECTHKFWRSRKGPEECEQCHDEMPIFIYECRNCSLMACRRCRYNRL
ncbi:hypothetical protein F5Y03DRAFT_332428 [Xylaria venustula]|nr:hypothetical protein F5Y03DRAFT_332428 [Xylaria venustula]